MFNMSLVNVFRIGSCRTDYIVNKKRYIVNTPEFTHTTREALHLIDLYEGKISLGNCVFPNLHNHNLKEEIKNFIDADIYLIEISSLKIVDDLYGHQYNINKLKREIGDEDFRWGMIKNDYKNEWKLNYHVQAVDDLVDDIELISKRLEKPTFFQSHANFDFMGSKIPDRKVIDQGLLASGEQKIILSQIFRGINCNLTNPLNEDHSIDVNHLTDYAYNILFDYFENMLLNNKII